MIFNMCFNVFSPKVSQLAVFLADTSHCAILLVSILAIFLGFLRYIQSGLKIEKIVQWISNEWLHDAKINVSLNLNVFFQSPKDEISRRRTVSFGWFLDTICIHWNFCLFNLQHGCRRPRTTLWSQESFDSGNWRNYNHPGIIIINYYNYH